MAQMFRQQVGLGISFLILAALLWAIQFQPSNVFPNTNQVLSNSHIRFQFNGSLIFIALFWIDLFIFVALAGSGIFGIRRSSMGVFFKDQGSNRSH